MKLSARTYYYWPWQVWSLRRREVVEAWRRRSGWGVCRALLDPRVVWFDLPAGSYEAGTAFVVTRD